ncbi:MAG: EAL domain-containing protein [Actinomycetota bacterium]|nr:EAL domain-containing protein [Actinomycetota bacterium]
MSRSVDVSRMRSTLLRAYSGLFVFLLAAYYLLDGAAQAVSYLAASLLCVAALLMGVRFNRPRNPLSWYLFAFGLTLTTLGDSIFTIHEIREVSFSFPSIADVFYLLGYPFIVAGLLAMVRSRSPGGDRASLTDAAIIATGLGLLGWIYLIIPYTAFPDQTLAEQVTSVAYPLMDLVLLSAAVRLAVTPGAREPMIKVLPLSVLIYMATDVAYAVLVLSGKYMPGSLIDAGWLLAFAGWGIVALHPSMRKLTEPVPEQGPGALKRGRLLLLASATLLAPAVLGVQAWRDQPLHVPVIVAASILLFLLVLLRMSGLVSALQGSVAKHRRAVERERTLRVAGAALAAAKDEAEVNTAAVDAAQALTRDIGGVRVSIWSGSVEQLQLKAAAGAETEQLNDVTISFGEWPDAVRNRLLEGRTVRFDHIDPLVQSSVDFTAKEAGNLIPLMIRDQFAGLFSVAADCAFPRALYDSLEALMLQAALALEGVVLSRDLLERQSEARFRSLVQNSSDVISIIESDVTIRYQSPSVEAIFGYGPEEMVGSTLADWFHPDDSARALALIAQTGRQGAIATGEWRMRHRDGSWIHAETTSNDLLDDPNVRGVVLTTHDVTERKSLEGELSHLSFHDSLTRLPNRALFKNRLDHALARNERKASSVSVLILDLDDFKSINDSVGHSAGDALLTEVAGRLSHAVRPGDTVARFGGDEFAVLLEDCSDEATAVRTVERIRESLALPFCVEGRDVFLESCIGIALSGSPPAGADDLLRDADVAMYIAKKQGKRSWSVFEASMRDEVVSRLRLKADLQGAVEQAQFILHYQPIVNLGTEEIIGMETLVRWQHPQRGVVAPLDFIPLAEETGAIVPLGRWVLRKACLQAALWQIEHGTKHRLSISVNVSGRQLEEPGLVDDVAAALLDSRLSPESLFLEITESVLMHDTQEAIVNLTRLKELGVRIAIDDFGTGYSSLGYLERFPLDMLKIDKSFVDGIGSDAGESVLAATIVQMADTLGLSTVAEGVETVGQLRRLQQLGCGFGQGYLFGKPLPVEDAGAVLSPGVLKRDPSHSAE